MYAANAVVRCCCWAGEGVAKTSHCEASHQRNVINSANDWLALASRPLSLRVDPSFMVLIRASGRRFTPSPGLAAHALAPPMRVSRVSALAVAKPMRTLVMAIP